MEDCSSKISTHQGMGTTQDDRFLAALDPRSFLIDERKEEDLIYLIGKLSRLIKFYNDANKEDGNWAPFFTQESTAILVQIYLWDINTLRIGLNMAFAAVKATNNIADQRKILKDEFDKIGAAFKDLRYKATTLHNSITTKEFLVASAYQVEDKLTFINNEVNNNTDLTTLITNNKFGKNIQQLWGLLYNWKEACKDSVLHQLEQYASHTPHYALFLAFLKLFKEAQGQLNEFTKKHLDLYYKEILQLRPARAVPDHVHLLVEPSNANNLFSIPKGTIFPASKNKNGQNKYYVSTADAVINNAGLKFFLASYGAVPNAWKYADLTALNGKGANFNAFNTNAADVETGLLITSPLLFLSGGERQIRLSINEGKINYAGYLFYLTGEKGLIKVDPVSVGEDTYLYLPPTEKKIIACDPKIHKEIKIKSRFPVLKIVPKTGTVAILLRSITIDVRVFNFKDIIVATDTGLADTTKAFKPFGDLPTIGNGFTIGCNEFFVKKGAKLNLLIYPSITIEKRIKEGNYEHLDMETVVVVKQLLNGKWENAKIDDRTYFNTNPIDEYKEPNKLPDSTSASGYLKLETNHPDHSGEKFLEKYIAGCKASPPDVPVAPVIRTLLLDYNVTDTYSLSKPAANNVIELYHILPFGHIRCVAGSAFPQQAPAGGHIYLGFENAPVGSSLSLLFQMAEGTANPRKRPATVTWHFLDANTWRDLQPNQVGDETNGLTQSGIVHITLPRYDSQNTTVLPAALFWIKIAVNETDAICSFTGIHERALKAVLADIDNTGSAFLENTPKGTITKLNIPISEVKKIDQPYASYGGKQHENDTLLYRHGSERLKHKKRAITSWDYERLVLDQFPEVYRVKCLNHYRYDATVISNSSAGYITMIPIARMAAGLGPVSWRPLVSMGTMVKIRRYLDTIASPHARILVKAPMLEKIQLKFSVKYHDLPGADTRLYAGMLTDTINQYLSPWAFEKQEVSFAATIQVASLIQLIDNQRYVDFITDLEIKQWVVQNDDEEGNGSFIYVKEIVPTTDYTLFIPNETHTITVLTTDC